ncbi:MAG: D-hexose-6-phosphate mutarotase [Nevskia sp.]
MLALMHADSITVAAADGARAVIQAQGAQLTSWRPAGGEDGLFLSARAVLDGSLPIRGGVPVIFPQFAAEGPLARHGFARLRRWTLLAQGRDAEGRGTARWPLIDDEATRRLWPPAFRAELGVVVVGASLAVALTVENTGAASLAFTAALHSYIAVRDIAAAEIHGLQHLRYRDSAAGGGSAVEQPDLLRFDGEVDRIYFDAPSSLTLRGAGQVLLSQSTGFADVVIWNPGAARAAGFADLAPGEWRRFVCIEPATIGRPVMLASGDRWEGSQTLTLRPLALND